MSVAKKVYTIANAHLDTSWLWTLETTIKDYIPETMNRNIELFEKYPDYKFNFEGSYRYELMEEYYPEDFKKVKKYVADGRWNPAGSCYENGDVNVPSPEALIRNILYGNSYFIDRFGKQTNDIFLPDCFGFGKALPSIAAHCELTGFSTQKLTWGCTVPIPYDVGRWTGLDGKGIWASINPHDYSKSLPEVRSFKFILDKFKDNEKYNFNSTMVYHGTGDRGGAPAEKSVKVVTDEMKSNDTDNIKVLSASTNEFFDDLCAMPEEQKNKMPVWDKEFLMKEHGAGSYTTRTLSKRWNKQSECLADSAERANVLSMILGKTEYPQAILDTAWKKTIAHQFHDDITGTSFQECYKRNWNDYIQSINTFSNELTTALAGIVSDMNTEFKKGFAVAVSNSNQAQDRSSGLVSVTVNDDIKAVKVTDASGNEVPSQVEKNDGKSVVYFIASVPSNGVAIYNVRPNEKSDIVSSLKVSNTSLENDRYIVKLNNNLDISSIFDKKNKKMLLRNPIRFELLSDTHSISWPAWEVKYEDLSQRPYGYPTKGSVKVISDGAARVAIEIVKAFGKSTFKQIISLDNGGDRVNVFNEVDWREEATDLKVSFPLSVSNDGANYDIGTGWLKRPVNTEAQFEVPAQRWADITDKNGSYGVSIISDSRSGWDMPAGNILRLTAIHTPMINHRWECSQHLADLGINRFSYAIIGHNGTPEMTPKAAEEFCKPMHSFVTAMHKGDCTEKSLCSVNNDTVRLTAVKKAMNGEDVVLRFVEYTGKPQENIEVKFGAPIKSVREITGFENTIKEINPDGNKLVFNMNSNEIKSFAISFDNKAFTRADKPVELPCNAVAMTSNNERNLSTLKGSISIPSELMPESILSNGIEYKINKIGNNAVVCKGQEIKVDDNIKNIHLLAFSLDSDLSVKFGDYSCVVPSGTEALAAWDLIGLGETGYVKQVSQAFSVSHIHNPDGDVIAKQLYLFDITVPVVDSVVKLPDDDRIVIIAASEEPESPDFVKADAHKDSLEKRDFDYEISSYAKRKSTESDIEKFLDTKTDRTKSTAFSLFNFTMVQSVSEIYYLIRSAANYCEKDIYSKYIRNKRNGN